MEPIIESLNWRYATKVFDPKKKLSNEQVETLLEVARLAPSSFGLAPWKFILVENPDLRKKIRDVAWNQSQVTDASHIIVFSAKNELLQDDVEKFIALTASTRDLPIDSLDSYKEMILNFKNALSDDAIKAWNERQTYIPLGMVLSVAAQMHIDACPMEGFDQKAVGEILGLTEYHPVAIVALGFRSSEDKYSSLKKVRESASTVVQKK